MQFSSGQDPCIICGRMHCSPHDVVPSAAAPVPPRPNEPGQYISRQQVWRDLGDGRQELVHGIGEAIPLEEAIRQGLLEPLTPEDLELLQTAEQRPIHGGGLQPITSTMFPQRRTYGKG